MEYMWYNGLAVWPLSPGTYLRVHDYFLQVLMLDISVDWSKNVKFAPNIISYMHYIEHENFLILYHFRVKS